MQKKTNLQKLHNFKGKRTTYLKKLKLYLTSYQGWLNIYLQFAGYFTFQLLKSLLEHFNYIKIYDFYTIKLN
jgi:hypothetical protein